MHERDLLRGRRLHGERWPRPRHRRTVERLDVVAPSRSAFRAETKARSWSARRAPHHRSAWPSDSAVHQVVGGATDGVLVERNDLDGDEPPLRTAGSSYLYSVSCAGADLLRGATAYNPGQVNEVTIWNGSSWSTCARTSRLRARAARSTASAASARRSCTAVGHERGQRRGVDLERPVVDAGKQRPAAATGSTRTYLFGVDCLTNWTCVAAGSSEFAGLPTPSSPCSPPRPLRAAVTTSWVRTAASTTTAPGGAPRSWARWAAPS